MFGDRTQSAISFDKLAGPESAAATTDARLTLIAMDLGSLHGSGSGSLKDILQVGLVATGLQQQVSFTGEMMGGILPSSLNSSQTSVVVLDAFRTALGYMRMNLSGWHPSRSESMVKQSEEWMREGGAPEESIVAWRAVRNRIEQARLDRWETLTAEEKRMISQPFPVLYGISSSVAINDTATAVKGEKSVSQVTPDKLTVFVPDQELATVTRMALLCSSACRVVPLSLIEK